MEKEGVRKWRERGSESVGRVRVRERGERRRKRMGREKELESGEREGVKE